MFILLIKGEILMKLHIKEKYYNLNISTKMSLFFIILLGFLFIFFYNVMPILLNYPPDTINTEFDKSVSITYYAIQCLALLISLAILFTIYFKVSLKSLDKWWKHKVYDKETVQKVRKKCALFPYQTYAIIEIFPVAIAIFILSITGSHPEILIFKIGTLLFSFSTLVGAIFLIFSSKLLYPFLVETSNHLNIKSTNQFLSLRAKLRIQLFPGILITALLVSLIGYTTLTREKGDLLNRYYKTSLSNAVKELDEAIFQDFETIDFSSYLTSNTDFFFIEHPDGSIQTSNGSTLSYFFVKYMHDLSPSHDNRVYESYTIDAQGVINTISYNGQNYTIGIYYEILSLNTFFSFLLWSIVLFIFNFIVLMYVTSSIQKDIEKVVDGLNTTLADTSNINDTKLPITTNDVLGELSIAFNNIQELTKSNIEQIHSSQDILVERERLASLGQMIGGIAHNLKTPIMSISGAAEGLSDLIKEYDSSIDDPEVNSQDHHDIAKDMQAWVEKVKDYTGYMSDVITAVKGQAVTLSDEQAVTFNIEELVKRVNILMKHELKNALINLNVVMQVEPSLELKGNINSLVQVINNMISNAIQSYNGQPDGTIDMKLYQKSQELIIEIRDHGCGLPKEVKEKLFKEMITTKGKNGTGLGLFMSYSNIRAHFNGNITFESEEGKGTAFYIHLPV